MFTSSWGKVGRSRAARGLMLGLIGTLTCALGCKEEKQVQTPWDGPAKLLRGRSMPAALPASKTNFEKVALSGGSAKLVVPVDWKQTKGGNKTWRSLLQSWEWIWPLLAAYDKSKDQDSLKRAIELALDWVGKDQPTEGNPTLWNASVAASRAEALGYLVHAGTDAKLLSGEQQDKLLTSVRKHAAYLANDENYKPGRPSSLYLDFGLAAMCSNLNKLSDCQVWKDIAIQRFGETSSKTFDRDSGLTKESLLLQVRYVDLVASMAEMAKRDDFMKLRDRLRARTGWVIPPDDHQLMTGGGSYYKTPSWATASASKLKGVELLGKSGFGVIKDGSSYLIASSRYQSPRYKLPDELSFSWFEDGTRILTESGRAKASNKEDVAYSQSPEANNSLTIAGLKIRPSTKPFGSGMLASGSANGWYALKGRNPSLPRTDATHARLWLYKPGKQLLVIDRVQSETPRQYDRYFHFWYSLDVKLSEDGVLTTTIKKTPLRAFDVSADAEVKAKLVKGQKKPVQGVLFLTPNSRKSASVLQLTTTGSSMVLGTLFEMGESKITPKDVQVAVEDGIYYVRVGDEKLAISQKKGALNFEFGVDKGKSKVEDSEDDSAAPAPKPAASGEAPAASGSASAATSAGGKPPAPAKQSSKAPKAPAAAAPKAPAPAAPKPAAPVAP